MSPSIAVTGATGQIGGRVARRLADAERPVRLLVRDAARAPRLRLCETAVASYADGDAVRTALDGIRTVFMVSASESADRVEQHRTFVDAAVAAGVGHLVYLSFFGASADSGFTLARDHGATEDHIRASGLDWTFLRDNFYAEIFALMAGPDHVIRGPARDGRVAPVGQDDVGAVAAAVLADPAGHRNTTYELTGPEAVTLDELAGILTAATGETYTYYDESIDEARASRASYGAPDWEVAAWISTYTAIADGELAQVSGDVERVLDRPATPLSTVFGA